MQATDKGILLNQDELAALLAFTGDDAKFAQVHFRVNQAGKLIAAATDGKRAVECEGSGLTKPGEWHVDRSLIEGARRLLDPKETKALLKATDKGLKKVCVVGIEDETIRSTHDFSADLTSTQLTMADIHGEIAGGSDVQSNMKGSWFALGTRALKPLIAVERAAGMSPVTIYPPKKPTGHVTFETRSGDGHWKGVICPVTVIGPGDEAETDDEDPDAPGTPAAAPKPLQLAAPLGTEKGKRKAKASKKPRKGAARAADNESDEDNDGDD
jgi:hypothetical protein